jgi:aryl-alcohol dehydrogenase (NADP+)
MMFGDRTDIKTAGRTVGMARKAGINFIDTADAYANGESERITGKLIRSDRDRWVAATKLANLMGADPNAAGQGRKWAMRAIDECLRRLGTDYVDVYYVHQDNNYAPIMEIVMAVADLVRAGKVRYAGLSKFRGWRMTAFVETCDRLGVPRPAVIQPYYNAMNRVPEVEILPAAEAYGIGVVPYSPLARGVLTGKYRPGALPPKDTRAGRQDRRMMETEWRPESLRIAQRIKARAEQRGMTQGQFATQWVLNNRIVTSVIAGPRTVEQWQEYLGALDHSFAAKDEVLVDRLVPPGHPSSPGYTDPRNPVQGRPARIASV